MIRCFKCKSEMSEGRRRSSQMLVAGVIDTDRTPVQISVCDDCWTDLWLRREEPDLYDLIAIENDPATACKILADFCRLKDIHLKQAQERLELTAGASKK